MGETILELSLERHDGTTVVTAAGEIDMASAPKLRACLANVSNRKVVIDLRAVSFIDSTGISVLVGARQRQLAADREFTLRKAQGMVLTALTIVGLAEWVED
jgi:anti-sigma B factor antagonist